jgi:hypothetical protein
MSKSEYEEEVFVNLQRVELQMRKGIGGYGCGVHKM